jgi:pyruvate/2-oxoglutarate dehydrogenase complex dihydrolipoamide acyltransferase (E2) component
MIGMLIEILVCVLLAATIAYCLRLDGKLKRLKADEQAMRRTITDLVSATEKAERAVAGLRSVVEQCDQTIAGQLRDAERHAQDLADQIRTGDDVIARIARIVDSTRGGDAEPASRTRAAAPAHAAAPPPPPAPAPAEQTPQERLAATLAAAQAFAERARRRVDGKAA